MDVGGYESPGLADECAGLYRIAFLYDGQGGSADVLAQGDDDLPGKAEAGYFSSRRQFVFRRMDPSGSKCL
jgi:hypothetical protein